jgi:hypothetical protein
MKPAIKENCVMDMETGKALVTVNTGNPEWDSLILGYALFKIDKKVYFKQCVEVDG